MLERHINLLRKTVADELTELNLLKAHRLLHEIAKEYGIIISSEPDMITAEDVLSADSRGINTIVSFGKPTETAKLLAEHLDVNFKKPMEILPQSILPEFRPKESEIDAAIVSQYSRKKHGRPVEFVKALRLLSSYRAVRYICVGIGLMLMSFFVGHSLYYRFIASLSIGFGGTILAFDNIKQRSEAIEKPPQA